MRDATHPLFSIVVLNWNGLENTKQCIESIRKLDYPNYELIIVDNGSKPEEKAYLSQLKDIVYVDNPVNRGFTGGHIDGLAKASGDFIVLMNNDALIKADYLSKALGYFDDPQVAVVGGRAYFWNDESPAMDTANPFYSYQQINTLTGEAITHQTDFGVAQEVNNVSGSCCVVRRSVINEVGYLYDRFFAYFEETDLFARVKRAGYKVLYAPELCIWHKNGASSGSTESFFVYHQLLRNRFIFAVRNFESGYHLRHFLYVYARISLGAIARTILKRPTNRLMNRAYTKAALYSFFTLPKAFASRWKLQKKLGKSRYNHRLHREQTGISFVIDATGKSAKQLQDLEKALGTDAHPMHEYIIVTKQTRRPDFDNTFRNIRYVTDRGYFSVPAINLGVLAARFDWVALCDPGHIPDHASLSLAIGETLNRPETVIALGQPMAFSANILIHKQFLQFIGGIQQGTSHSERVLHLLQYAERSRKLRFMPTTADIDDPQAMTTLSKEQKSALSSQIALDQAYNNAGKLSWFGRVKVKHYRIYQVSSLIHWIFLRNISIYLKLARIKNLILFTVTLRRQALALELKHIRNEVVLSTTAGNIEYQRQVTDRRIAELLKHPDIPVFIICRDRLECLTELVDWLQHHGLQKIVFVDNDSLYPPLVEYFQKTPHQVLKLYRNVGHTSPWSLGIIRSLIPEDFYIVTDPDVIPSQECPKDVMTHFLDVHKRFPAYQKVGFGLRIDDLPDEYPLKKHVIDWEDQFWLHPLDDELYEAGVDTTFALYKPFTYTYTLHPSIRTGKPYTARHLPWYALPGNVSAEEDFYRAHLDQAINSWNVDALADRYTEELQRQKKHQSKKK